jgi:hypothetical protein
VNAIRSTWLRERRRELAIEPTERRRMGPRTLAAYGAAIVVPVAVAQLLAYELVNRAHRPAPRGAAGITA